MPAIRNFSIIAHIDHGKSTLADRLIQRAGKVDPRLFHDQYLDSMDLEQERGITIKSAAVTLSYVSRAGETWALNLIDTPGHVDFTYEVSRALASCEGVLLLIDAAQGVEAQTVANLYLALEQDLAVIPVINKIDLPAADPEMVREQIDSELGLEPDDALLCSARNGIGIDEILEAVIARIPAPKGSQDAPLSALIFDAHYDAYRGAIISCRLFHGEVRAGQIIRFMSNGATFKVEEVGRFYPNRLPCDRLVAGEVGYIISGIKTVSDIFIGDTVTLDENPTGKALAGFKQVKPVVFSSVYPVATEDYPALRDALDKYKLNDAALVYERDSSAALGQGFRCGFLGLLHLEIFQERLAREFDQALVMTAPSVRYQFDLTDGSHIEVDNPAYYPEESRIVTAYEPWIRATIMMPDRYVGAVTRLCLERRGADTSFAYPTAGRVEYTIDMPLAEVIYDFYDKLKSVTQGYGSFDYTFLEYRTAEVVRLDILVNGERVDALSLLVQRDRARPRAVLMCERLKDELPRQQFKVAIQGALGKTIICRETLNPLRKDVTAKCYGGDITRKRKLLERQAEGKKKMRTVGRVEIPQHAYVAVLKSDVD